MLDVVVAEHDERRPDALEQRAQLLLAARPRHEITRDEHELRLTFAHPLERALDGVRPA